MTMPLDGVAVIDASQGVAGQFAARLLGSWGASVLLVEPPQGTPTRRLPPFRAHGEGLDDSLLFWHLNTGKRSVRLDPTGPPGRAALERLVASADVLVTDAAIDVEYFQARLPRLIACRIREFAPGGPYETWRGSELIHQALSGLMHTTGRADKPPLHGFGHRAYYSAGAAAAASLATAILERDRSGAGQRVELSVHEVAVAMSQNLVTQYGYSGANPTRGRYVGACDVFHCADGWAVTFCPTGRWSALCESLAAPHLAQDERFAPYDRLLANWPAAAEELSALLRTRPVEDVVRSVQAARSMAARVYSPVDVVTCEHLAARSFWRAVQTPEGPRPVLGPPLRFDGAAPRDVEPAPALGPIVHDGAAAADSARPVPAAGARRPLEGVRILELTTAWAGPMAARILMSFGADVIKLESVDAMDVWRGPVENGDPSRYPDRVPGPRPYNRNAWFNTQNHGKRSLALDLKAPGARDVLAALVPTVDVVLCNFSDGVLDRLGLGFEQLRRWRPDVVLVEMPVAGRGGPLSRVSGVGPTMEALSGMTSLSGYGDDVPTPTGPAYLDPIGAMNGAAAAVLGLRARDRSGDAQRIELAQREAALHWLGERLLEAAEKGTWTRPTGNAVEWAAPHDAYPAAGSDQWVAIAVLTDEHWVALCEVIGHPALATSPRLASVAARVAHRAEVDELVAAWTRARDKADAARALQAHGVPAAAVLSAADLHDDPQLAATDFYVEVEHPEAGRHRYQGLPFHFSRTPARYGGPAPCLGEHTEEILREIGLAAGDVDALARARVVHVASPSTSSAVLAL